MRVCYVGNFRHPWCTEVHVSKSLQALGHTVLELQEDRLDWRELPTVAADAHLVLWTRTWAVELEAALQAIHRLRDQRVPIVSYHLDRWWGLEREYQVHELPFFRTDLVVSPDGGSDDRWKAAGVEHLWLPPGVYAGECGPVAPNRQRWPHDVVFVGTVPYPHAEWGAYRQELVDRLAGHFGRRFKVWPASRTQPVRGRQLQQLYATARVVVGDSCLAGDATRYWSDRVPETLGRGGLLVHPAVDGLDEWYRYGDDLLVYEPGDFDSVVALAEQALASPEWAQQVRDHGRATVLGRDTYEHRMTRVLDEVEERFGFGPGPLAAAAQQAQPARVTVRHRRTRTAAATFELAPGDADNIAVWEVWQDDTYQLERGHVNGLPVVDVGCNVGAFAVLADRLGASVVHAYEPVPRLAAVAEANAAANRARHVHVHRAAVGGAAGEAWLQDVGGGGAHLTDAQPAPYVADGVEPRPVLRVPVVDVNDVVVHAAGERDVGYLKVDCEGGEYAIVDGLKPDVLQRVRRLTMEFHGPAMPHLTHLDPSAWGPMVAKLAEYGRLRVFGRPSAGGLLWWERY